MLRVAFSPSIIVDRYQGVADSVPLGQFQIRTSLAEDAHPTVEQHRFSRGPSLDLYAEKALQ